MFFVTEVLLPAFLHEHLHLVEIRLAVVGTTLVHHLLHHLLYHCQIPPLAPDAGYATALAAMATSLTCDAERIVNKLTNLTIATCITVCLIPQNGDACVDMGQIIG
jgi:hypothetical protein